MNVSGARATQSGPIQQFLKRLSYRLMAGQLSVWGDNTSTAVPSSSTCHAVSSVVSINAVEARKKGVRVTCNPSSGGGSCIPDRLREELGSRDRRSPGRTIGCRGVGRRTTLRHRRFGLVDEQSLRAPSSVACVPRD